MGVITSLRTRHSTEKAEGRRRFPLEEASACQDQEPGTKPIRGEPVDQLPRPHAGTGRRVLCCCTSFFSTQRRASSSSRRGGPKI
jgi:hypothetical protein